MISAMQTWLLFLSSLLALLDMILGTSLVCFKTPHCNCSTFNREFQFDCGPQLAIPVTVTIRPPNPMQITQDTGNIKIFCSGKDLSSQWPDLLKGLNIPGSYLKLQIQGCPIPDKSIKWILEQFNADEVKFLVLDYIDNREDMFQTYHFEKLEFVERLSLMFSNITTLPQTVFSGLPNLKYLFLNNNKLLSVPVGLFQPLTKLGFLDLGKNNLTELDPQVFKTLPQLRILNIHGNRLRNLKRPTFSYFRNLTSLDLNSNGITTFSEDLFQDLSTLTSLNLKFNNISTLPGRLFSNMTSLKQVHTDNSFSKKSIDMSPGLFSNLVSLMELTMNGNNLSYLPENVFRNSTKLQNVTLNTNSLTQLPSTLFEDCKRLQRVDLGRNKLTELNATLFRGLKDLKELRLNDNQLKFINETTFDGLSSLEELDLQNNRLIHLEPHIFSDLKNLKIIRLNNNSLTMRKSPNFEFSLLSLCLQIEQIHLQHNLVDIIFQDWIFSHVHLQILDLRHNKIKRLSSQDLQFVAADTQPVKVYLDDNEIETVDMMLFETTVSFSCDEPPCMKLRNLDISMSHNPLNCDCQSYDLIRYFQRKMSTAVYKFVSINSARVQCTAPKELKNVSIAAVNLDDIYCSWDQLPDTSSNDTCPDACTCRLRPSDMVLVIDCSYVKSLPQKLPQARFITRSYGLRFNITGIELNLSNNGLRSVKQVSQLFSPNVIKLTLSSNALKDIDDLRLPERLKVLELDHNEISRLNKRTIERLNETNGNIFITLHNNPWECDCNAKDLLNFMQAHLPQILHINNITCAKSGRSLIKLKVDDLCQISLTLSIICVSLAFFGLIFGLITFLYYKYEHEIKVWMFAHKICLWLVTEKEVDRDKKYDAFISYSHLDENFIADHLKPGLENGPTPFKLCLHYRDWLVGDNIPKQVVRSVESSRRTIVVLSPNYLNSVWGIMEFRTAYMKAVKERRPRVIVILYKDIDSSAKVDPELKAYLTMNTYLKWGDPWFWEKLRYAMPHPQQYSKQAISLTKEMQNVKDSFRIKNKLNIAPCSEIIVEKCQNQAKPDFQCSR